jgi:ketosteroid isomerase-like protein
MTLRLLMLTTAAVLIGGGAALLPAADLAAQQGVWQGTFRRYDANGVLVATLPSEIVLRVTGEGDTQQYHQTNRLWLADGKLQEVQTYGELRDGELRFSNDRVVGVSTAAPGDPSGLSSVLTMQYRDGSDLQVHEIISVSPDGLRRSRAAQYLKAGRLERRTLIDEVKVTADWAAADRLPAAVQPVVSASDAAEVAAVRAVGETWRSHYAAGRFSEIPDLYTTDTVVMPRGRPRIDGREQMRRSIGGLAAGRHIDIEVTERELVVAAGFAWYVGEFRVTYTSKDATTPPKTEYGRSLIIFKKGDDGRWRIHRDIDSPAPEPST